MHPILCWWDVGSNRSRTHPGQRFFQTSIHLAKIRIFRERRVKGSFICDDWLQNIIHFSARKHYIIFLLIKPFAFPSLSRLFKNVCF